MLQIRPEEGILSGFVASIKQHQIWDILLIQVLHVRWLVNKNEFSFGVVSFFLSWLFKLSFVGLTFFRAWLFYSLLHGWFIMYISPLPPFILLQFNVFLVNMGEPKPNKIKYYIRERVDHTFSKSEEDCYFLRIYFVWSCSHYFGLIWYCCVYSTLLCSIIK